MTEEEKLDAGLYYDFWDAGVNGRKLGTIKFCRELRKHYNVTILPGVTIGNNVVVAAGAVVTNKAKRKHQTTTGKAGSMAKDIMDRHGQKFDAYYSVIMPDIWTPVFDLTDRDRVDKWLSDGKNQLELVIDNIMSKRKGDFIDRKLPKWVAAIPAAYMYATERKTKNLSVNWKNVKCVLDVFTDARNLQSAMATEKLTDMDSIKIHILEFKRKHRISGERNSKS